jgi:hypothetical protein
MKYIILFFSIALSISSCTYDKNEVAVVPLTTETVYYSKSIKPIITTNCTFDSRCHAQGGFGPGYYEDFNALKTAVNSGKFKNRVFDLKDMPPSYAPSKGVLSTNDITLLKSWIVQGALNN